MRLPFLDCCRLNHTVGLVPHPHQNMDISSQRDRWPYTLSNTSGGGLLLRHSDIQHVFTLSPPQQARISPSLPLWTQAAQC